MGLGSYMTSIIQELRYTLKRCGNMKVPCKGCIDRQPGCHDKCDKYKAFNDEREAIRNKRHVNVESRAYACDGSMRNWKNKKGLKKKVKYDW